MIAKRKKSSLLLTLGTSGLLITGGVAAYWVLVQRNGIPDGLPAGARIIPQSALLSVSVSTDQSQWQHLRQFGTKTTQAELDRQITQLRDRFLTTNGYDYQQDIQPWVGKEVTLAFLPQLTPTTANTTNQPSMVMVLPIANPLLAKQLLAKPLKQGKWIESMYKNVKVEQSQGLNQNYSTAVLDGRFLVLTDNFKATQQAIDTYKGGASIASTPGYTEAIGKISAPQPFAELYLNIPAAASFAVLNTKLSAQGLATTVTLEPEGIGLKSISWLQPNAQKHVVENKAGKMPSRLPANTLMMVSGGNLQQLWQDYLLSSQSNTPSPENFRSSVTSATGLDLDRDLLSWMKAEFSLSLIPSESKLSNNFAISLLFMVQTSDRAQAEKVLRQLDQTISSRYQFQVQPAQIAGQPVVNWIAPYGTLTATHGWLDGDVAFLSVGAPVAERIMPKPSTTLAGNEQFQKTVPLEPNPNNGQLFVDLEQLLKTFPLSSDQTLLPAIRSIGITTAVSDEHSVRYNILISLKRVGAS